MSAPGRPSPSAGKPHMSINRRAPISPKTAKQPSLSSAPPRYQAARRHHAGPAATPPQQAPTQARDDLDADAEIVPKWPFGNGEAMQQANKLRKADRSDLPHEATANTRVSKRANEYDIARSRPVVDNHLRVFHAQGQERAAETVEEIIPIAFIESGADIAVITSAGFIPDNLDTIVEDWRNELDLTVLCAPNEQGTGATSHQSQKLGHTIFVFRNDLSNTHELSATSTTQISSVKEETAPGAVATRSRREVGYHAALLMKDRTTGETDAIVGEYVRPQHSVADLKAALKAHGKGVDHTMAELQVRDWAGHGDFNAITDCDTDEQRTGERRKTKNPDTGEAMTEFLRTRRLASAWHATHPGQKEYSRRSDVQNMRSKRLIDHAVHSSNVRPVDMEYLHGPNAEGSISDHAPFHTTYRLRTRFKRTCSNRGGALPHAKILRLKAVHAGHAEEIARLADEWIPKLFENPRIETAEELNIAGLRLNRMLLGIEEQVVGYSVVDPGRHKPERDTKLKLLKRGRRRLHKLVVELNALGGAVLSERQAQRLLDGARICVNDADPNSSSTKETTLRKMAERVELIRPNDGRVRATQVKAVLYCAKNRLSAQIKRQAKFLIKMREHVRAMQTTANILADGTHGTKKFDELRNIRRPARCPVTTVEIENPETKEKERFCRPTEVLQHAPDYYERFQSEAKVQPDETHRFYKYVKQIDRGLQERMEAAFTLDEVKHAIARMSAGSAAGRSMVHPSTLKALGDGTLKVIVQLFNACWDIGEVPDDWKEGLVCALYKGKGSTADMSGRRPIALLDVVGKAYAHVLRARLAGALEESEVLDGAQMGFRAGHDCTEAARMMVSALKISNDLKTKRLYTLFVDLARAFDTVPVWLLKETMQKHGVAPKLMNAILSMYKGYRLCYLTAYGPSRRVDASTRGEKQGCPLSATLFPLVMNPLLSAIEAKPELAVELGGKRLFAALAVADDLAFAAQEPAKMETLWKMLLDWANYADLIVSVDKTRLSATRTEGEVPGPHSDETKSEIELTYEQKRQTNVESSGKIEWLASNEVYRYVGLDLNSDLDWSEHNERLLTTVRNKVAPIMRLAVGISTKAQLIQAVVPATIAYTARIILPERKLLQDCDAAVAKRLNDSIHATGCKPTVTLALLGVETMEVSMIGRYIKSIAQSTLARTTARSAKIEAELISKPIEQWSDSRFEEAEKGRQRLEQANKDDTGKLLGEIDYVRNKHHGVVPLPEILGKLGLTLVRGGEPDILRPGKTNARAKALADRHLADETDIGSQAQEIRRDLKLDEIWTEQTPKEERWLTFGTDGSKISEKIDENTRVHLISHGIAVTATRPKLKQECWSAHGNLPTDMLDTGSDTDDALLETGVKIVTISGNGNGLATPYNAEAHAELHMKQLCIALECNGFLFADALSLLSQIRKMKRLANRPTATQYVKYGSVMAASMDANAELDRRKLQLVSQHVFSHTDDKEKAGREAREEKHTADHAPQTVDNIFARFGDPRDGSDRQLLERVRNVARAHKARHNAQQQALEAAIVAPGETEEPSAPQLDHAGFAELAAAEERRLLKRAPKREKTVAEKITLMDEAMGTKARRLGVELNKQADAACEKQQQEPKPLAPCVAGTPAYAIAKENGSPLLGNLAAELAETTAKLTLSIAREMSIGILCTDMCHEATFFPLQSLRRESIGPPQWTGGPLGDHAFKSLTNTVHTGRKATAIGGTLRPAIGKLEVTNFGPLSPMREDSLARWSKLREQIEGGIVRDAIRRTCRTARQLATVNHRAGQPQARNQHAYVDLHPKGTGVVLSERTIANVPTFDMNTISDGSANNARQTTKREWELTAMSLWGFSEVCHKLTATGTRHTVVDGFFPANRRMEYARGKFKDRQLAACPFCLAKVPEGPVPIATTEHITATCPSIGPDIAEMIYAIHAIIKEHAKDAKHADKAQRPADADQHGKLMIRPWFNFDCALSWARQQDTYAVVNREIAHRSIYRTWPEANPGDATPADERTAELGPALEAAIARIATARPASVGDDRLRDFVNELAHMCDESDTYANWPLAIGDRGGVPQEAFDWLARNCTEPEIAARRIQASIWHRRLRIYRRYDLARKRINNEIKNAEMAATNLRLAAKVATRAQSQISRFFQPHSGGSPWRPSTRGDDRPPPPPPPRPSEGDERDDKSAPRRDNPRISVAPRRASAAASAAAVAPNSVLRHFARIADGAIWRPIADTGEEHRRPSAVDSSNSGSENSPVVLQDPTRVGLAKYFAAVPKGSTWLPKSTELSRNDAADLPAARRSTIAGLYGASSQGERKSRTTSSGSHGDVDATDMECDKTDNEAPLHSADRMTGVQVDRGRREEEETGQESAEDDLSDLLLEESEFDSTESPGKSLFAQSEDEFEVEAITAMKRDHTHTPLFRVKWRGYSDAESTWEPASHLLHARRSLRAWIIANSKEPAALYCELGEVLAPTLMHSSTEATSSSWGSETEHQV